MIPRDALFELLFPATNNGKRMERASTSHLALDWLFIIFCPGCKNSGSEWDLDGIVWGGFFPLILIVMLL